MPLLLGHLSDTGRADIRLQRVQNQRKKVNKKLIKLKFSKLASSLSKATVILIGYASSARAFLGYSSLLST